MKKLMALAIVLLFAGATRSWALFGLEDVTYDGSLEFAGISANNEIDQSDDANDSDHRGEVNSRLRLGVNAKITEGVKSRIEFMRRAARFGRSIDGTSGSSSHINEEFDNIFIENAYVEFENLFGMKARLGRQFVGNPGDLVWNIAPIDDDYLTSAAIDGLLLQCRRFDFVHTDLFMGKARENEGFAGATTDTGDSSPTDSDVNLNSLDFVLPTLIPGGQINLGYLLGRNSNDDNTSDSNVLTTIRVGARGGVRENMFTYRAEFFQNGGEDKIGGGKVKYEGNAIDLGAGFNSQETSVGKFGVALDILAASGDSDNSDDKDKAFHDFSIMGGGIGTSDRIMGEIFGKSAVLDTATGNRRPGQGADTGAQGVGLNMFHIGANWTPTFVKNTNVKLDFFTFNAAEDGTNTDLPDGDSFGDEIDLVVANDHSANVRTELGYAIFMPGKATSGTGTGDPDDNVTKLFARATVKWGGEN